VLILIFAKFQLSMRLSIWFVPDLYIYIHCTYRYYYKLFPRISLVNVLLTLLLHSLSRLRRTSFFAWFACCLIATLKLHGCSTISVVHRDWHQPDRFSLWSVILYSADTLKTALCMRLTPVEQLLIFSTTLTMNRWPQCPLDWHVSDKTWDLTLIDTLLSFQYFRRHL